jgi:pullulanase/glycogen debranching enzyme
VVEIAKEVLIDYRIGGTQTPGSTYQRNLSELTGDVWSATMKGTTKGGDPLPPAGVFAQILEDLAILTAKVDALSSTLKQ